MGEARASRDRADQSVVGLDERDDEEMADRAMDAISPVEVAGVGRISRAEVRGTAEGTTEQAVQKARAGAGGTVAAKPVQFTDGMSDAAAEQLLAKYPQWNEVKEFVGKHLDPNNLPPGYQYRVKNGQARTVSRQH